MLECDTDGISSGDELLIRPDEGLIRNVTAQETIKAAPLMDAMLAILQAGGLKEYVRKENL